MSPILTVLVLHRHGRQLYGLVEGNRLVFKVTASAVQLEKRALEARFAVSMT
jgi:hypothetical protein